MCAVCFLFLTVKTTATTGRTGHTIHAPSVSSCTQQDITDLDLGGNSVGGGGGGGGGGMVSSSSRCTAPLPPVSVLVESTAGVEGGAGAGGGADARAKRAVVHAVPVLARGLRHNTTLTKLVCARYLK